MKLDAPGITLDLPPGWEAEVDGGSGQPDPDAPRPRTPRTHIANFPLRADRGDYGSFAVEEMPRGGALICLLEEAAPAAGSRLHGLDGVPRLSASDFSPDAMQRPQAGRSGAQAFFHVGDRAFVLYVVIAERLNRAAQVDEVNRVLAGVTIHP
ncbi:MAG: hypothetical protein ACLGIC_08325 [Acidimicrobiia bacterium]